MANYPMNIWVINENEFESFTYTGGKVIYIAEQPEPKFASHPAIVTAGALLPPVDAIQAELDDRLMEANIMYSQYLQNEEADPYISVIITAAFEGVPIGMMFGRDEMNMKFPAMLIDFLYMSYGLILGVPGKVNPQIVEDFIPQDLAKLYNQNIIDYQLFMTKHPNMPIHPAAISKLAYEINPIVDNRDFEHFSEYFNKAREAMSKYGKFLVDPMEAVRDDYLYTTGVY